MSSRYQLIVLKKCLTLALFVVNFLGLWSFRFVGCKSRIKYSYIKAIHSIVIFSIGLCTYAIISKTTFAADDTLFFGSFTLRLVLFIYGYAVLVSFAIAYLGQHWMTRKIEITYTKCMDVVDTMGNSFWPVDFSNYLIEMLFKAIIFDIFQGVVSFNNMTNSSVVIRSRPLLSIILLIPYFVGRFHTNIFFGALLAINVYMKKLNCYLTDIVSKAAYINGQNGAKNKCFRMDNYCYFSDEIDKLSDLYLKLVDATKSLNSIFSVAITFWNAITLLTLITQFLYQFASIIEMMQGKKEYTMMMWIFGYISILLSTLDLLATSNACQRIVNSVSPVSVYSN